MATVLSGIGLMGASAYIVSAAALHPSIADLQVAIVAVRFFGIARGLFRYLERTTSHQATFRLLARLRVWFYTALEPLAPARLLRYRSGDLLARMQEDIESLENFYVRVLAPPLVAAGIALCVAFFLWRFDPRLALSVLLLQALAGIGLPLLVRRLSAAPGREQVAPARRPQRQPGGRHPGHARPAGSGAAGAPARAPRSNGAGTGRGAAPPGLRSTPGRTPCSACLPTWRCGLCSCWPSRW